MASQKEKIFLTGGYGLLGRELRNLFPELIAPPRSEFDIKDKKLIFDRLRLEKPTIVIHAAAMTDNRSVEKNPEEAISSNIIGSAFLALACIEFQIRLVYISTDYVYKGDRGLYNEDDEILPSNLYAWSKLGGESSVRACPNHLIIRTSFGQNSFEHPKAFSDKWSSKDTVSVIAPLILKASLSSLKGIINIGTDRKTVYDYAVNHAHGKNVECISIEESPHPTSKDTSFDLKRWKSFLENNK